MSHVRFGMINKRFQIAVGLVKGGKITNENIDRIETANNISRKLDRKVLEYARELLGK